MRVKFLGTGTSTGVPEIGCQCEVCRSSDKKDQRLRASILIHKEGKNILVDCGPDFRKQMLSVKFEPITGLLITHEHYDHVGGIDDLRPFCRFGDVNIYVEDYVCNTLKQRIPYCFAENKYPGIPNIRLNKIENRPFSIEDIIIHPIRLMHYRLPIFGYRIDNFAYLTDLKSIPDEEYDKLQNLDVLVMNALRIQEHVSHQNLEQALDNAKRIGAKKTYLTHISHQLGLHQAVEKILSPNVFLAYDGLEIEV